MSVEVDLVNLFLQTTVNTIPASLYTLDCQRIGHTPRKNKPQLGNKIFS